MPVSGLPEKAIIQHIGSDQRYEVALKWDAKDIAESSWDVPKDAKTGVTPKKAESALTTRAQRSEVKKRAAELKKKQTENAAANQGK